MDLEVDNSVQHYVYLFVIIFVSQSVFVIAGIGFGLIAHTLWQLAAVVSLTSGNVSEAVGYIVVGGFIINTVQSIVLRKHICWSLAIVAGTLWAAFQMPGYFLLDMFDDDPWIKRVLGMVLALMYIYFLYDLRVPRLDYGHPEQFHLGNSRNVTMAILLGITAGFLSGLFALPLPVLLSFTLMSNIPKDQWRATLSVILVGSIPTTIWYYFIEQGKYTSSRWPHYIIAATASLLAAPVGNWLSGKLNQLLFRKVVLALTSLGALSLMLGQSVNGIIITLILAPCGIFLPFLLRSFPGPKPDISIDMPAGDNVQDDTGSQHSAIGP